MKNVIQTYFISASHPLALENVKQSGAAFFSVGHCFYLVRHATTASYLRLVDIDFFFSDAGNDSVLAKSKISSFLTLVSKHILEVILAGNATAHNVLRRYHGILDDAESDPTIAVTAAGLTTVLLSESSGERVGRTTAGTAMDTAYGAYQQTRGWFKSGERTILPNWPSIDAKTRLALGKLKHPSSISGFNDDSRLWYSRDISDVKFNEPLHYANIDLQLLVWLRTFYRTRRVAPNINANYENAFSERLYGLGPVLYASALSTSGPLKMQRYTDISQYFDPIVPLMGACSLMQINGHLTDKSTLSHMVSVDPTVKVDVHRYFSMNSEQATAYFSLEPVVKIKNKIDSVSDVVHLLRASTSYATHLMPGKKTHSAYSMILNQNLSTVFDFVDYHNLYRRLIMSVALGIEAVQMASSDGSVESVPSSSDFKLIANSRVSRLIVSSVSSRDLATEQKDSISKMGIYFASTLSTEDWRSLSVYTK